MKFLTKLAVAALAVSWMMPAQAQDVMGDAAVKGAGSTFAFPVISKWAHSYREWVAGDAGVIIAGSSLDSPPPGPSFEYEPVGSLAGTMRVSQSGVDFGASDVPLNSDALTRLNLAQFPIVIGGVAIVFNLDGVGPGQLRLNGATLTDIFLGKIDNWSDPAIAKLNPGVKLPNEKIAVVRRSDGSGTTFNFTSYLSAQSPDWKQKVGADLLVPWPVGSGAKGNDGLAAAIKRTKNSIGYVEYAQALRSGLSFASLENRSGNFVKPDPLAFQVAAANANWAGAGDFSLLLLDAPGDGAYPLVATVFALMKKDASPRRTRDSLAFFDWALTRGANDAASLGYVPLPDPLVARIKAYWSEKLRMTM